MINSILSTQGAQFITFNLANFYLKTLMKRPKFMRIAVSLIPKEIMEQYVYFEINKGMYVLPQARKIANNQLIQFLKPYSYHECWVMETHHL
mmetsp:Transcript_17363/g.25076  ORF Transcript_17363/g.25076 Transcript_17363/m.25076 type:complete len:92 (+) Transcript_17363:739-1014(+)